MLVPRSRSVTGLCKNQVGQIQGLRCNCSFRYLHRKTRKRGGGGLEPRTSGALVLGSRPTKTEVRAGLVWPRSGGSDGAKMKKDKEIRDKSRFAGFQKRDS